MSKSTVETIQLITEILYELDPKQLAKVHAFIIKAYQNSVDLPPDYKKEDPRKDYKEWCSRTAVLNYPYTSRESTSKVNAYYEALMSMWPAVETLLKIRSLANATTPQDLATAEFDEDLEIDCPMCDTLGTVHALHYYNYDGVANGVTFFGIGDEPQRAQAYFNALKPSKISQAISDLNLPE